MQQLRDGKAPSSPFGYDTVTLRESSEGQTITDECEETCLMIEYCIGLREKYLFEPTLSKVGSPILGPVEIESKEALTALKTDQRFKMVDGVVRVFSKENELLHEPPASATAFFHDLHAVRYSSAGPGFIVLSQAAHAYRTKVFFTRHVELRCRVSCTETRPTSRFL